MLQINWIQPLLLKLSALLLYCTRAFHSDEKFEACSYVPQFHCDISKSSAYRHCIMSVMPTLVIAPVALAMYCITVFVKQRTANSIEFCSTHPRFVSVILSKTQFFYSVS